MNRGPRVVAGSGPRGDLRRRPRIAERHPQHRLAAQPSLRVFDPDEQSLRQLDAHLRGYMEQPVEQFRCFREAIPHLRARGGGRLLATSSVAGAAVGWAEHTHYATGKAGISTRR